MSKPEGLSPNFNSYIFENVEESFYLSWNNRTEEIPTKTIIKIESIAGAIILNETIENMNTQEYDASHLKNKLTLHNKYKWSISNTFKNGKTYTSSIGMFIYGKVVESSASGWGKVPEYIDVVERGSYFAEFRQRAVEFTNLFKMNDKLKDRASRLFTGDVVPSDDDFSTLDEIFIISSNGKYGKGTMSASNYVSDTLGVSDIHRIRELFLLVEALNPDGIKGMHIEMPRYIMPEVTSLRAYSSGIRDNSIDLTATTSSYSQINPSIVFSRMASGPTISYYKVDLLAGPKDKEILFRLYYPATIGDGHKETMNLDLESIYGRTSSAIRFHLNVVGMDVFGNQSAPYNREDIGGSNNLSPGGRKEIEYQYTRKRFSESKTLDGTWSRAGGGSENYTHYIYSMEGHFAYRARYVDYNGYLGSWEYSGFITYELPPPPPPPPPPVDPPPPPPPPPPPVDPPPPVKPPPPPPVLQKPDAPKLTYTSTTNSVTVSWGAAARAERYEWRLWSNDANIVKTTARSFTRGTLGPDKGYDFYVRAHNKAGYSGWTYIQAFTKKQTVTTTWSATYANSWRNKHLGKYEGRSSWRVRGENGFGEALQGEWVELAGSPNRVPGYPVGHAWGKNMGMWLFNSADIRNKTKGKTIKKVEIYVTRGETHGYYHAQQIGFYLHRITSAQSQFAPMPHFFDGFKSSKSLSISSSAWIEIPLSVGQKLQSGHANGIGVYAASWARLPYMRFKGNAQLRITYE